MRFKLINFIKISCKYKAVNYNHCLSVYLFFLKTVSLLNVKLNSNLIIIVSIMVVLLNKFFLICNIINQLNAFYL